MTYATIDQFIEAFTNREAVALSNSDDPAATSINFDTLQRAIDDASAEIDSYLSGRYTLPFPSPPKVLVIHCLNIVRYRLAMISPGEDVRLRYEDSLRFLKMIAEGKIDLGIAADNQQIPGTGAPAFVRGPAVWTEDNLRGF